jgi:hypothetical protein
MHIQSEYYNDVLFGNAQRDEGIQHVFCDFGLCS